MQLTITKSDIEEKRLTVQNGINKDKEYVSFVENRLLPEIKKKIIADKEALETIDKVLKLNKEEYSIYTENTEEKVILEEMARKGLKSMMAAVMCNNITERFEVRIKEFEPSK